MPKIHYLSASEAGRGIVGLLTVSIDIFLEVQNEQHSQVLYLIEYNVHRVHFCIKIYNFNENWVPGGQQRIQTAAKFSSTM